MIHKTLFTTKISDGYSFRNTISMFKNENPEITLLVSVKGISISFMNKGNNCIHDVDIRAEDLQYYSYGIAGNAFFPITVNTNQLLNTTKGVGRKDAIKVKWIEGWKRLIIQLEKSGKASNRASDSYVDIIDRRYNKLEFKNEFTNDDPCIKMLSKEFSEICAHISALKCSYMEVNGNVNKITFKGIMADESIATTREHIPYICSTDTYKDIDSSLIIDTVYDDDCQLNIIKPEEFIKTRIPVLTVKALSKLPNIAPNGVLLKFYFIQGKPLKIESVIGTYGNYNMYLRNPKKM
jgi:hypothetical protein